RCRDADTIETDATHDEQWHRDRNLQSRGHAMNAADAEAASTSFVLQRGNDDRTTEPRGRQKSEYETGREAEPETKCNHRKIDSQQFLELNRNQISAHPRPPYR